MKPWQMAAAVIAVVALLAGTSLLVLYTPGQTSPASSTSSSGTSATTSTTTGASNGLELRLALTTKSLAPGEPLGVAVSEFNTQATANNVTKAQLWNVAGLSLGACGTTIYPFGVAVFRGSYVPGNVSQAQHLQIYPSVACPMLIRLVTGYLFQPTSDLAVLLPSSNASPTSMSANVTVTGEYAGTFGSSTLHALSPGVYTVAAGDEWGSVVTLQFSVGGGQSSSTTGTDMDGVLSALVTIGPTVPVCSANATAGPAPSSYSSIKAVLTPSSGSNTTVSVNWLSNGCDVSGRFQAFLAPGSYQLSLSPCTFMGCRSALPEAFTIAPGQQTALSVSIDTGIR